MKVRTSQEEEILRYNRNAAKWAARKLRWSAWKKANTKN